MQLIKLFLIISGFSGYWAAANALDSQPIQVRWTKSKASQIADIITQLNLETHSQFQTSDFKLIEKRDLATSHFEFWAQTLKGVPLHQRSIRLWTDLNTHELIQMEAWLEPQVNTQELILGFNAKGFLPREVSAKLSSQKTLELVRSTISLNPDDSVINSITWSDLWYNNTLARRVKVKGHHGFHIIWIDLTNHTLMEHSYQEFPQMEIPALVYPIWEEAEGGRQAQRIPVTLKNIKPMVPQFTTDPYAVLRNRRYFEDKMDPLLGLDPVFEQQGY